jgi:glycosyltransferase involved in cell wall biosynthesis
LKLCFICSEYPPGPHGGTGTFTQVIARALSHAGHQVKVAGVYSSGHPAADYEEDEGVQVWRLREPKFPYGWVLARYRLYHLVKRWIQAGEADLVEAPDHEGWFACWPKLPVPLVKRAGGAYSYFAHDLGKPVNRAIFRLEKWSYHRADAWITKSRYTGAVTSQLFELRSAPNAVLYNPVDAPDSVTPFASRNRNEVVFTGTLTPKKGVIQLADAWPKVKEKFPAAELHLYGRDTKSPTGGSMQSYLQGRLPSALKGSVHFHGHVRREDLFGVLASARVAVFPSFSEGFAWAPLESMAYGCPTIYTRLGSGPELIEDGTNGLLVDPNNPAQIAEAILKLLTDDNLSRRLSEEGRSRILNSFTLENLLPMNEAVYSNLIKSFQR